MSKIIRVRQADENNRVVSIAGARVSYRREPCDGCPWRCDNTGEFPAEAFKHSAETAYDMSQHLFACHESGIKKPATCAGFLLRGAAHNLSVRLGILKGIYQDQISDGGHQLHANYREMAIANGVDSEDPRLLMCRD